MLPGFGSGSEAEPPERLLDAQRGFDVHCLGSFAELTGREHTETPSLLDRTVKLVAVDADSSDIDRCPQRCRHSNSVNLQCGLVGYNRFHSSPSDPTG